MSLYDSKRVNTSVKNKWRYTSIRQELIEVVNRTLEQKGYKSLTEFITNALRVRLDELNQEHEPIFEKSTETPIIHARLMYSPDNLWVKVTPQANIRIGLSDHAQRQLEGVVSIRTDRVGSELKKGKPFGTVETWMFRFNLYAPISGEIIKINKVLQDDLLTIHKDPYETGWIVEIKCNDLITLEEELRDLMSSSQYRSLLSHKNKH